MYQDISNVQQGDLIVLDMAVFHRAGVDGTCHIEEEIEYVVVDDPNESPACCVLTVEQEEELDASIAAVLYTVSLDLENGVDGIESHRSVYEFRRAEEG